MADSRRLMSRTILLLEGEHMSSIIRRKMPMVERLAGLAEEACELAQAALKLRRVFDGTNPTPKREEDAIDDLIEEIADVNLYLSIIDYSKCEVDRIMKQKKERWERRLEDLE